MESSVVQHQTKIKELLEKLLHCKCHIKMNAQLDRLVEHVARQERKEEPTSITLSIFSEWIARAVAVWCSKEAVVSTDIAAFTLKLASLLSTNERRFYILNTNNFFIKLVNVTRARQTGDQSVKLGYIELLTSFLQHKSGIEWMMACNFWEDIYRFGLTNQTVCVRDESCKFMSKLLVCAVKYDANFCSNIINRIMQPLGNNIYRSLKVPTNSDEPTDEIVSQNLKPTLKLIADILEYSLEGVLYRKNGFRIPFLFLKNFHLEERISDFMLLAKDKHLVFDLGKVMYLMQFLELYVNVVSKKSQMTETENSVLKMQNNFLLNTSSGSFENVMEFCDFGHLFWNLMVEKISLCSRIKKDLISFGNQLVIMQLMPNFCLSMKYCYPVEKFDEQLLEDEFRNVFIRKLFKISSQDIIRLAFHWRDFLIERPDLFELCTRGLYYFKKSRKHYPRERAVMVFQCYIYILKDVVAAIKEFPEKWDSLGEGCNYFYHVFDCLAIFIEEFQITWRDSFEAIDVMDVSFDFLSLPDWPKNVVVQALKLINISIAKYMSPNLALLVDRTADSAIALLGPLLFAKLHDDVAEVRSAALGMVHTMAGISTSSSLEQLEYIFCQQFQWHNDLHCRTLLHVIKSFLSYTKDYQLMPD